MSSDSEALKEYNFTLEGDLGQMGSQMNFLLGQGFDVQQRNVYPIIKECDVEKALKLIYENKIEGWWHYDYEYEKFGICSKEKYNKKLHDQVEANKKAWENRDKNEPLRFKF